MSQELFDIPGLQLPDNIYNFDSNIIIRKINKDVKENFSDADDTVQNSDRDDVDVYDVMGERNRLVKENKKLKADVERLKELNKLEKKVAGGKVLKDSSLLNAAAHLSEIILSYDCIVVNRFSNHLFLSFGII